MIIIIKTISLIVEMNRQTIQKHVKCVNHFNQNPYRGFNRYYNDLNSCHQILHLVYIYYKCIHNLVSLIMSFTVELCFYFLHMIIAFVRFRFCIVREWLFESSFFLSQIGVVKFLCSPPFGRYSHTNSIGFQSGWYVVKKVRYGPVLSISCQL